jgi:hypothetical protein
VLQQQKRNIEETISYLIWGRRMFKDINCTKAVIPKYFEFKIPWEFDGIYGSIPRKYL